MPVEALETTHLWLRALRPDDAFALYAYARDPEATRFVAFATHRSPADAEAFIGHVLGPHDGPPPLVWAITRPSEDRVLGTVGIHDRSPDDGEASLGYILHPDLHGRGFATEAVRAVVEHVAHTPALGIGSLLVRIDPENPASLGVAERCGFTPVDPATTRIYHDSATSKRHLAWERSPDPTKDRPSH